MKALDWLSISALVVSIGTFIWVEVKEWLKRPRLNLFLQIVTFVDRKTQRKEHMVVILMINDGYSPIIISQCKHTTIDGAKGEYGIYDELKMPYGKHDIVLPTLLNPADKFQLNFIRASVIEKINSISLFDSRGKEYKIPFLDIKNVQNEWKRRTQKMDK
jgi:hypothetical protein